MLDKDFNELYKKYFTRDCPPCISNKEKSNGCASVLNKDGKGPSEAKCKMCWRYILEQQEPEEEESQPELFRDHYKEQLKPYKL